jgi:hypothetical protein
MLNTKENMVLFYLLAPAEVHLHLMHHLDVHNVGQQTFKKSTECMYSTTRIEPGELEEKVVSSVLEHTTQHGAIEGKTQTRSVRFYNVEKKQVHKK